MSLEIQHWTKILSFAYATVDQDLPGKNFPCSRLHFDFYTTFTAKVVSSDGRSVCLGSPGLFQLRHCDLHGTAISTHRYCWTGARETERRGKTRREESDFTLVLDRDIAYVASAGRS